MGCFQIESPGQRELLGKFQPTAWEDLIIDISLFRPGPVKSDMVVPYLERRHGFRPVEYPHRMLAPILKETNGVIVYHEQVMRVIAALCGGDMGEADKIRRQLDNTFEPPDPSTGTSAHLNSEQQALKDGIVARAVERGWKKAIAESVWDNVLQFASFGFCKAHAAAFAVPTYQSAWLKAHYLAEFYCGILTHEPGMYPRRAILADARAHGVPILPVDVNRSGANYIVEWTPEPDVGPASHASGLRNGTESCHADPHLIRKSLRNPDLDAKQLSSEASTETQFRLGIRLALKDVRGISEAEAEDVIGGRPWKDFEDFCERARVDRPVVEALVHCGGFDSIKGKRSRRELYWSIRERWAARVPPEESQLQLQLTVPEQIRLPGIADYSQKEKVEAELEVLGLDAS
ncbi:MAG: DNA polymerase III subunit alpha, partial [Acidimicrobiia bacterium]